MSTLKEILTRRPVAATIRLTVPAGGARPAPPVGPVLGQYRLNLMAFCKDFNARTQKYKPDTPMAVIITAFKDNTFEITVRSPSVTWYLKKAAGSEKGSGRPGHVMTSSLILKHVYEIAKVKQQDPYCQYMPLSPFVSLSSEPLIPWGLKSRRSLIRFFFSGSFLLLLLLAASLLPFFFNALSLSLSFVVFLRLLGLLNFFFWVCIRIVLLGSN